MSSSAGNFHFHQDMEAPLHSYLRCFLFSGSPADGTFLLAALSCFLSKLRATMVSAPLCTASRSSGRTPMKLSLHSEFSAVNISTSAPMRLSIQVCNVTYFGSSAFLAV